MSLKCLWFCLNIWAVSCTQKIIVSQPNSTQGIEGETVTLSCSYSSGSKPEFGSFWWVKDRELDVKNTTMQFQGRVKRTSTEGFLRERRADIEIQDLRYYDSGMYRCVVSLPGLPDTSGNGTVLRVVKPSAPNIEHRNNQGSTVLIWLAAGLGLALVVSVTVLLIFVFGRKKRGRQAKASRTEYYRQDHQAEANLNYAELTVKKGKKPSVQTERVTYAAVKRHGQEY